MPVCFLYFCVRIAGFYLSVLMYGVSGRLDPYCCACQWTPGKCVC